MKIEEQLAAMAVMAPEAQELLKNINPQEWADTFVWMSQDWLEMDKLLGNLGYPTQKSDGRIYPLADRFGDFCLAAGLDISEFLRHWQEMSNIEEEE